MNKFFRLSSSFIYENSISLLFLYQSSVSHPFNEISLRSWQKDLLSYFDNPNERQIIWVTGIAGNEGKSFFQKYVKSLFGTRRVILLDMIKRSDNIFHIMSKQSLICKDIFLFNLTKSFYKLFVKKSIIKLSFSTFLLFLNILRN